MPEFAPKPYETRIRTQPETLRFFSAAKNASSDCVISPDGTVESASNQLMETEDFAGCFVTQGLVDLQVNGFAGVDFNQPAITAEQLDVALTEMARTGVTTCLPTVITGSHDAMIETVGNLDAAVAASRLGPLMVAGYHIEGPFLSRKDGFSGAHQSENMSVAKIELVDNLRHAATRPIRIMTVAPEVDGVVELIPQLVALGMHVAIGHSAADQSQISAAVQAGATLSTHLGNGVPLTLHRTDNPIFWQLAEDKLTAMFIPDGIHIPQAALQSMLRAKGIARTIVTTDAVSAAGLETRPGLYRLGKAEISLSEDRTVRKSGSPYLAGSSVTMDKIVRNLVAWYGFSIPQVLEMALRNPTRILSTSAEANIVGQPVKFVEWRQTPHGPQVAKTHIGPFTIQ